MSTRQEKEKAAGRRLALSDLYATAMRFMLEGKRDQTQIAALIHALQLFKENRLAATVAAQPVSSHLQTDNLTRALQLFAEGRLGGVYELKPTTSGDELRNVLSRQVGEVFDSATVKYLTGRGVTYVGELFLLGGPYEWRRRKSRSPETCRRVLTELGVPLDLDLDKVGWIPPYAQDENVLKAWATVRSHNVANQDLPCSWRTEGGCGCLGEHFRKNMTHNLFPGLEEPYAKHGLKAVMYVPPTWNPPAHDPESCLRWACSEWSNILIPIKVKEKLGKEGVHDLPSLAGVYTENQMLTLIRSGSLKSDSFMAEIRTAMAAAGLAFRTPSSGW